MIILAIRTDSPKSEMAVYKDDKKLAEKKWQAQGVLVDTINAKLEEILNMLSISLDSLEGIVCFAGPGSFTGLRIGLSFGNALAYAQNIPVVATKDEDWVEQGIKKISARQNQKIVTPYYDRPAATPPPKK